MSEPLRLFVFGCGIVYTLAVVWLLLKNKINERNSIVWIFATFAILLFSAFPQFIDVIADWVKISYPPALVFLFSTLIMLLLVLHQSMQISALNDKLKELAQRVALSGHLEPPQGDSSPPAAFESNLPANNRREGGIDP